MWEELTRAIPIYFSSMLKFIFGPVGGYLAKLNILTTILTTVAGMMTVVIAFAFFGDLIKKHIISRFFKRKNFSDKNRKFVQIWRKYGLAGVAALTPLLLTPIGGVLLAVSFGSPRDKLIIYMFISASFWAVVLTLLIYIFGNAALEYFRP